MEIGDVDESKTVQGRWQVWKVELESFDDDSALADQIAVENGAEAEQHGEPASGAHD